MSTTIPAILILIAASSSGGGNQTDLAYEFPSMELCYESIKNGNFEMPNGNESEGYVMTVCVPKEGGKWSGITFKDANIVKFPN